MSLLHLEPRPIETSGVTETRAFTMKANGKAFKVLIDGLYSDKVRAVIRELCSNAFDAHVAANNAHTPFDLHLPTRYEPYFSVRDYGTSMSHADVMGLYTTVFESSKENSSTQVGKLGLGSKSPFAYTDTFTVTAVLDGEKRMYSAYIGADYIPQIAMMSSTLTDEPNGVEVSFPTKAGDEEAFQAATDFVMIGFDVAPNLTGNKLTRDPRGKVLMSGKGWAVYDGIRSPYARQGCVIYPINSSAVAANPLLKTGVVIDFEIGTLEISASREGLGYDAPTVAAISSRLEEIADEIYAKAAAEMEGIDSVWNRMIFMSKLSDSGVPSSVLKRLRKDVWGDEATTSVIIDMGGVGVTAVQSFERRQLSQQSWPKRYNVPWRIAVDAKFSDIMVFVDGAKPVIKNQWGRMQGLISGRAFSRAILVRYNSTTMDAYALIRAAVDGAPDTMFLRMEDLPAPLPSLRSYGPAVKARVVGTGTVEDWDAIDINMRDGGVYVATDRKRLAANRWDYGRRVSGDVDDLKSLGHLSTNTPVFGIPFGNKALKNGKWVSLTTVIENAVRARAAEIMYDRAMLEAQKDVAQVSFNGVTFPAGSLLRRYRDERIALATYKTPKDVGILKGLAERYSIKLDHIENPVIGGLKWRHVTNRYPLLRHISEINSTNISDVLTYVEAVDNKIASAQAA